MMFLSSDCTKNQLSVILCLERKQERSNTTRNTLRHPALHRMTDLYATVNGHIRDKLTFSFLGRARPGREEPIEVLSGGTSGGSGFVYFQGTGDWETIENHIELAGIGLASANPTTVTPGCARELVGHLVDPFHLPPGIVVRNDNDHLEPEIDKTIQRLLEISEDVHLFRIRIYT